MRRLVETGVLRWVLAGLATLAAVAVMLPEILGLDGRIPFALLIAFRPWAIAAVALASIVASILVLGFRRRPVPAVIGPLAVALVGGGAGGPRAIPDRQPGQVSGDSLEVLTFNARFGRADVTQLAALIARERPDLVSLQEAGPRFASRLAPLVAPLGYRWHSALPSGPDIGDVVLLTSREYAGLRIRSGHDTRLFPFLVATGGRLGTTRFVVLHTTPPNLTSLNAWHSDLELVSRWCGGSTPAIVAGDFNATLDHRAFRQGIRGCGDAADQLGKGLVPTWSRDGRIRFLGVQIDHVVATTPIRATSYSVHTIAGSDHRAVLVGLRLPQVSSGASRPLAPRSSGRSGSGEVSVGQ